MTPTTRSKKLIAKLQQEVTVNAVALATASNRSVAECAVKTAKHAEWHTLFAILCHPDLLPGHDEQTIAKRCDELMAALRTNPQT